MVYLLKLLNLSGVIASIASFPLVIVPVGIYLFIQHRGPEMRPWQKKALGVTFALGICAYAVDVADRFGHVDPLLAKLPPEIITDQTFINREGPVNRLSLQSLRI